MLAQETRLGARIDEEQTERKEDKDENEKNMEDICERFEKLETWPPQEAAPSQSAAWTPTFVISGGGTQMP